MSVLTHLTAAQWSAPLAGAVTGVVIGYAVRRARLCSFGAVEDALMAHDWRRMKAFGLALAIAIILTQYMLASGWLDPAKSSYTPLHMPWLSILIGSLLFGLGMAYVGTCAFGTLVRLGGGDLRGLVTILIFSLAAYAVLRGALAPARIFLEHYYLSGPGGAQTSFVDLAAFVSGSSARWMVALSAGLVLGLAALLDRRLWRAPRLLTAAASLGLGVAAGWFFTGVAIDPFSQPLPRLESLTFVAPTARAVFLIANPSDVITGFGVAVIPGVVAGSFIHALRAREFRWEAFDDQYEMRRHIGGAVLMGAGGILAGGCTIGQGLTAGSMLSYSWPLAVGGMMIGARMGLGVLLEGSMLGWVHSRLDRRSRQGNGYKDAGP